MVKEEMKKEKGGYYPPYRNMDEFNAHVKKMNFLFLYMTTYSVGIAIGFLMDINLRYG